MPAGETLALILYSVAFAENVGRQVILTLEFDL
jgi:hypothetical protein